MGSRKDPVRAAKREKLTVLLQQPDVNFMQDINDLFKLTSLKKSPIFSAVAIYRLIPLGGGIYVWNQPIYYEI